MNNRTATARTDYNETVTTKNACIGTGSRMDWRKFIKLADKAGIWTRCSHGKLWVRESDLTEACRLQRISNPRRA